MISGLSLPASEIKKIAVFRALQLGDMLCSVPAIRALRQSYPDAEITLLGLPWAKSFTDRFNKYLDRFIWFPGFPGLPEQPFSAQTFCVFLQKILAEKFDLVIQMQGNGTIVNPMLELLGGRYTAGFFKKDTYYPDNRLFMEYPDRGHEAERHLALMSFLGIPNDGSELEFPLFDADYNDFAETALPLDDGKYICIHPGSRGVWRRWPAEYFAKLADTVAEAGLTPVITGTKDELDIVNDVASHMNSTPVIAAGKTSMGAVAVLIKKSAGLISNCTGVSHIAAALKTPSVVISLDGEPQRWAPQNRQLHEVIDWTTEPNFELVHTAVKRLITYDL